MFLQVKKLFLICLSHLIETLLQISNIDLLHFPSLWPCCYHEGSQEVFMGMATPDRLYISIAALTYFVSPFFKNLFLSSFALSFPK